MNAEPIKYRKVIAIDRNKIEEDRVKKLDETNSNSIASNILALRGWPNYSLSLPKFSSFRGPNRTRSRVNKPIRYTLVTLVDGMGLLLLMPNHKLTDFCELVFALVTASHSFSVRPTWSICMLLNTRMLTSSVFSHLCSRRISSFIASFHSTDFRVKTYRRNERGHPWQTECMILNDMERWQFTRTTEQIRCIKQRSNRRIRERNHPP